MPSILLRNGTVLVHAASTDSNSTPTVTALKNHAVLIINCFIAQIGANIEPPNSDTKIIDCTGKIISPGFIDTHHHVWQTQSKGTHGDHLLLDYLCSGSLTGATFAPRDVFWGQLGGCLEAIDGGTTTIVDHSNINYSSAHSQAALSATISSGVRSFYAFTPVKRLKSWNPFEWDDDILCDWEMRQMVDLAKGQPYGDGRVNIAFGFDWYFLPKQMIVDLFDKVRALGIKLITSHYTNTPIFAGVSLPALLADYGLLKPDIIFSHANQADVTDAELLHKHGGSISSTPDTELQLALGLPVCFRPSLHGISSLGVDCHSNNSGDILSAMRLALQTSRGVHNQRFLSHFEMATSLNDVDCFRPNVSWKASAKNPKKVNATVENAFNLGTILGAKAIGMETQTGSLQVGKYADVVIFDATSPGMVCAAEENPVAAIVQHASVRDIDCVIIDGEIRKENGKLSTITVEDANIAELGFGTGTVEIGWKDVVRELGASRERLRDRWSKIDFGTVRAELVKAYHINEDNLVDDL